MGRLPRIDLKLRLTLRIVALAALCFAAASAYVLVETDRQAQERVARIAGIVAADLALEQDKRHWVIGLPDAFPDLRTIAEPLVEPGLCIGYRAPGGEMVQRFCGGVASGEAEPPGWFAWLYRIVFDPGRVAIGKAPFGDRPMAEAVAWADPDAVTAQAWHEAGTLLGVIVVTLLALCGLVYAALARALAPTRLICAGLERIAANDLSARLPPFDLAELTSVRDGVNQLAESLQRTLDERSALTRRLIAVQDEERCHLARELHDEFGQCLAAIRALAASAGETASRDCPALLPECEAIARIAAQMTETLRGALFRLRPPDVEELGLGPSLEGLVAGWNGRLRGHPRFEIRLAGVLDGLPQAFGSGLYRIAQEALTNAAKHAAATRVTLILSRSEEPSERVELVVENDGGTGEAEASRGSGMGLLGIRERVESLGGRMEFVPGATGGSVLRVLVPVASLTAEKVRAA
jgi:signal transduction histidine kinase